MGCGGISHMGDIEHLKAFCACSEAHVKSQGTLLVVGTSTNFKAVLLPSSSHIYIPVDAFNMKFI